eukprot:TRINITY_DN14121_c0_g1_i1.p1 TRINITY_DN14121_c0_g1~~TRINITY_DN14121_c0_g1_i1.p1  ORF type:complete len:1912 (+),score=565.61 TRINITY_DN14121_c0_g1_i1:33-5768(+)
MSDDPTVDTIWDFLSIKDGRIARETAASWLLMGTECFPEILTGVPEILTEKEHAAQLILNIENETGILIMEQAEGAEEHGWLYGCTGLKQGDFTYTECIELIADTGMLLRGNGVKVNGTDIDTAIEALSSKVETKKAATIVGPEALAAGIRELGVLARPEIIFGALVVAVARLLGSKDPIEELIDEGNAKLELLHDEIELSGEAFRNRKPMRPFTDEEIEVYEVKPPCVGVPKRGKHLPFCTEEGLTNAVLQETLKCWYSKTLGDFDDVSAPTVLDEIVTNLRVPKKSEGHEVGDPTGLLADVALALYARLGPSHPHLTPAGLLIVWLCTMEGVDIDRLLKFNDVPPVNEFRPGEAGGTVATTAGTGEEYTKRYGGRRNPSIIQEISLAMRGVKDTCSIPTSAIVLTITSLDGLNSTYVNENVYLEVHVKGCNPQTSETKPFAHNITFSETIIVPLPTPTVTLRITAHTTSGKNIGHAETKYPPPDGVSQQKLPITPAELRVRASVKLATITISTQETQLDTQTMVNLLESLGGGAQKQRAQDNLMKWIKVNCLLQALQARTPFPLSKSVATSAQAVQQHATVKQGSVYTWLAPTISSGDNVTSSDGSNALVFRSGGTVGIDATTISFYPDEKTIITSPFASHTVEKVEGTGPITISINNTPLLPEGGIVLDAALQRFYNSCMMDLARADEQLKDAQDRNWVERSRHLVQLVADGYMAQKLRDEKAVRIVPQLAALPDHLHERLSDRLAPLPMGIKGYSLPRSQTPLAFCTARAAVPSLLSELILMWFDKDGDVLDELMENLVLPDEASALAVLAHLSAVLADRHSDQPRNWAEILVLVLLTLESYDIDRICLLSGTPPLLSTLAEKDEYVLRTEITRNASILHMLCMSLGSMADYQHSATLAANASKAKRAAMMEPYKASKEVVGKWIKVLGLIIAMCEPHTTDLYKCATPAPGETERINAIEEGMWGLWAAPSLCSKQDVSIPAREGALKVKYTIKGVVEALDLTPYRRQHCPWDTSPAIMLPPLVTYLVGDVQKEEGQVSIELFTREVLSTSHPAIRKWREAVGNDCNRADSRLKEAFGVLRKAKERETTERLQVGLGKKVVLPSLETVHTAIELQKKEYRYILNDKALPGHCNRASVGVVGNVTDAIVTTVEDLRRNIHELAAEMRGEEIEVALKPPPPKVVSVVFDDGSIFLFPTELLTVHPVTWMPKMPSKVKIIIRWCELMEGAKGAHTRMQTGDITRVTDAPINDQVSFASSQNLEEDPLDTSNMPLVRPGDPCRPMWEERFDIDIDRVKLAEGPLHLLFTVFAEPSEEEIDEYDNIVKDLNNSDDEPVIGVATLSLHYHILLETIDKQREFPLVLRPSKEIPATKVTLNYDDDSSLARSPGILTVALQLIDDGKLQEEEEMADLSVDNAEPLSWRAGEYASDRICTGCDVGGDEYTEAHYVCAQCDAKLCDECWEEDHRDPRKHDHLKLLLFYHCDFCFVDHEAHGRSSTPALWSCRECDLNLCKSCWYGEHKHPERRSHTKDFLYPDGEDGVWAAATVLAQTVTYHAERFYSDAVSYKTEKLLLCGVCREKDAVYSWPTPFERGEGFTPLLLCEEHMKTQTQDAEDEIAEAEANNLPLPPPRPRPTLLLDACYLCSGLEEKPAVYMCKECSIPLCSACWRCQHKHPQRRSHTKESILPELAREEGAAAHTMMCEVEDAVANMSTVTSVEMPKTHVAKRSNEADMWRARLREREAGINDAVDVADLQQQRDERARLRATQDGDILTRHNGYIGGGGDIGVSQRITLEEAKKRCMEMPECKGFTFKEEPGSMTVRVFFKSKWNLNGQNKGWVSYKKEDKPIIGLCSHGALRVYCGECQDEEKRYMRPNAKPPPQRIPSNLLNDCLEARLANMIWDSSQVRPVI